MIEVGAGNGINFEHYPPSVTEIVAVEPESYLRAQAEKATQSAPVPTRVTKGTASMLAVETGSADVLVVCGVLCSVSDQTAALAEFHCVLRPGGELRFYEHVRSRRTGFARWQGLVDGLWSRMMGGCHTDRDTLSAITDTGFALGFGWITSFTVASELGDITRFSTPTKFVGYTGLCPRVSQSGDVDLRGPVSKRGPRYLRWGLMEAAAHACKHDLYRERYQRIKRRHGRQRGAKVAQIDLSRQLAIAIWHMLTRNQPFAPAGATFRLAA